MNAKKQLRQLRNLSELKDFLRSRGGKEVDWTDLPSFGGEEPRNTAGVWSWDPHCLLVGECARDLEIIFRERYCE